MTYQKSRTALLNAIKLPHTSTIALHGDWGTGKTHLWRDISTALEEMGRTPIYISCMDHNSMHALKAATFGALLLGQSTSGKIKTNLLSAAFQAVRDRLPKNFQLVTSFSELQPLLHLLHSNIPAQPVIAFDDIERVPDTISPKELIGFILSLATLPQARIVLIANKSKLATSPHWSELREKAIGIEVALITDTEETVTIGLGNLPPVRQSIFSNCIKQLEITNIRTIQKIRRTYDALESTGLIPDDTWELIIPSIVLFIGVDQGTLSTPITLAQALSPIELTTTSPENLSEQQQKARELLRRYNLGRPDDFETQILLPYIKTGHLNHQNISGYAVFASNRRRRSRLTTHLSEAYQQIHWSTVLPTDTIQAILEDAKSNMDILDFQTASTFIHLAEDSGLSEMAKPLAEAWINRNQADLKSIAEKVMFELDFGLEGPHPLLRVAIDNARAEAFPKPTFGAALEMLSQDKGSQHRHLQTLSDTPIVEIRNYVETCSIEERRAMFYIFKSLLANTHAGHELYKIRGRIVEALRQTFHTSPGSRLGRIIDRETKKLGISLSDTDNSWQS
ncbi:ATP-binding protein [Myxococcus sp. CA033]|uniref:ATP-binding protein n=1 Tax=Myxococcus sp. CA033 TaxID=2741516 RepID=UPI00157B3EA1|nr:P-loop NTPase fold protein [Myxococcus sp. CA033]NTX39870.1 ATP-binding protein [Myxococcus sp. CA033]